MKIVGVSSWLVPLQIAEPYTIAYETITRAENVFIRLETSTGKAGFGCAAPDPVVTGETGAGTLTAVDQVIRPLILGRDPLRITAILENLRRHLKRRSAALAMVDMALRDLLGKIAGLPLYQLLGAFRRSMVTSVTIGILPPEETLAQARGYLRRGFRVLKIKGGLDVETDIEKVCKLRELCGAGIGLRFDANQGYSADEALKFVRGVRGAGLELLEQPTVRDNFQLLGSITRQVAIPVMADESLLSVQDVFRLAKHNLVDMVNIKLMKTGGISNARRINAIARAANIDAMVGCMDESALAIAAGLHFTLSSPNVTHADLDGHLDLVNDPADGAVILKAGRLYPTGRPGLGFDPRL
jgi:L-alanine-DL-glutamate epimerase-like enolase superfamily enzyme